MFKYIQYILSVGQPSPLSSSKTFISSQKETLYQLGSHSSFPLYSTPGNLYSAFCISEFAYSRYFT